MLDTRLSKHKIKPTEKSNDKDRNNSLLSNNSLMHNQTRLNPLNKNGKITEIQQV